MDSNEERDQRVARQVLDWAASAVDKRNTVNEVIKEMRAWAYASPDRPWHLAVVALGCAKEMMVDAVGLPADNLVVAQEGSWMLGAMQGPVSRDPDVVTAMQMMIAMLNHDAKMVYDLLVAHERAGGPPAVLGVACAATGLIACMLDPAAWTVTTMRGTDDWRL